MIEPITFHPIYMTRVWGGRELERVYGRCLPDAELPYGESWEIVDRPEAQSVVTGGRWASLTLGELWRQHRVEVFGAGLPESESFPILIKVLDARDDLSIQVHPPSDLATELGGEPKTEMWYIADCDPGATLYVGLKKGVDRARFERSVQDGSVAACVHEIQPRVGDSIFIPSGRLHAIGAGFLIHEIQQNSDTTYRVFDWNRAGLDGQPRELHVKQSLASIQFDDIEPGMDVSDGEVLARCEYFETRRKELLDGERLLPVIGDTFSLVCVVSGQLVCESGRQFSKGQWMLLPRGIGAMVSVGESCVLQITLPI